MKAKGPWIVLVIDRRGLGRPIRGFVRYLERAGRGPDWDLTETARRVCRFAKRRDAQAVAADLKKHRKPGQLVLVERADPR